MSTLRCPNCGNTIHWNSLVLNDQQTSATCAICGETVSDPTSTCDSDLRFGNVSVYGPTVIGNGSTVIGNDSGY